MLSSNTIRVGTAGWSIPAAHAAHFATDGTHLQRYASRLCAVEINSSFHRPHRAQTYEKWAASVPADFRFAVKVPKSITHTRRLRDCEVEVNEFLDQVAGLGLQLGPLLVQLPPSLKYDEDVANAFFAMLRERFNGRVACEPRHESWFTPEADGLLVRNRVARVAADPAKTPAAAAPGGWNGLVYYRLHGSPRMYYSAYHQDYLTTLIASLKETTARGAEAWCIFDNTASGAAIGNALQVLNALK